MRLLSMHIRGYKAVDAELDFRSPVVVLFGENDSGKSNILEAVAGAMLNGLGPGLVDPELSRGAVDGSFMAAALVELDGLRETGHPDRALLAELLQFAPSNVSRAPRTSTRQGGSRRRGPRPARLAIGEYEFDLGADPVPLDTLVERLRLEVLHYASESATRWHEVAAGYETLLDACLQGRHLWWDGDSGVWWLAPARSECRSEWIDAAAELDHKRDAWREWPPPLLDNFIPYLTGDLLDNWAVFLDVGGDSSHAPLWDVVQLADTRANLEQSVRAAQDYIEWRCGGDTFIRDARGRTRRGLEWLEAFDGTDQSVAFRFPTGILRACDELQERANKIAPLFVTSKYGIMVVPLEPDAWTTGEEGLLRIEVELFTPSGYSYALDQAASGLSVWTAVVIREAARQLRQELRANFRPLPESAEEEAVPGDNEGLSESTPSGASTGDSEDELVAEADPEMAAEYDPKLVFILDEPERHLHPLAQQVAAEWIADHARGSPDAIVVVATHAPSFLVLPSVEVEYCGVLRDEHGATSVIRLTDDITSWLDEAAELFGMSRGDVLQLYQRFLVVEGRHDEAVLRRLFRQELKAARVLVIPLDGLQHLSVAALEFLARVGKPIVLLCDNVRAEAVQLGRLQEGLLLSSEERQLRKVLAPLHGLTNEGPISVQPFDEPDILTALPEDAVRDYVRQNGNGEFRSWEHFKKAWQAQQPKMNVKEFFILHFGLDRKTSPPNELVPRILAIVEDGAEPARSLREAVVAVLKPTG